MPVTLPFRKVVCPFCFHKFHLGHAPCRILSSSAMEPDEVVQSFLKLPLGTPAMMRPVEKVKNGFWSKLGGYFYYSNTRNCKREVKSRICPECHMPLPFQLANNGEQGRTIAVIGYRNTGKSNFLGVLIRSLQERYSREVGLSIHALESFDVNQLQVCSSDDLYQRRYGRYLDEARAVAGTPTLQTNPDIRIPMIYRLNLRFFNRFQRLLHPFSHHRPLDLILFDAAGEDLDSTETQQLYSRYISYASGIILLVDPLAYPSIRRDVRSDIALDSYSNEFDTFKVVMDSMSRYNSWYRADRKIRTPLAVVFSKFDELRPNGVPLDGLDPSVFNDHVHDHGFAKDLVDDTSEKIYQFLDQRRIGSVLSALDEYRNYRLFGMAALGQSPAADHSLSCISPINIADPLLWILYELGYLPAEKEIAK